MGEVQINDAVQADLVKLAAIPDDVVRAAARKAWVKQMAKQFQVTTAFAEYRLAGVGPYLPKIGATHD